MEAFPSNYPTLFPHTLSFDGDYQTSCFICHSSLLGNTNCGNDICTYRICSDDKCFSSVEKLEKSLETMRRAVKILKEFEESLTINLTKDVQDGMNKKAAMEILENHSTKRLKDWAMNKFGELLKEEFANILVREPVIFSKCEDARKKHQSELKGKTINYKCNTCDKIFKSSSAINAHKKSHLRDAMDEDGTFHCTHCSLVCQDLEKLTEHRIEQHVKPLDFCPICNKQMSKGSLLLHLNSHYKKEPLLPVQCIICSQEFSSPILLGAHMGLHRGDFSCLIATCRRSFFSKKSKTSHEKLHQDKEACPYCSTWFDNEQVRLTHVKEHEDAIFGYKFLCEICGKNFVSKKELQSHSKQYHQNSSFQCKVCEKSFKTSQRLKVHSFTHDYNKNNGSLFKCVECGKEFGQKISLESHLSTHHGGEMRYICEYCDHPGFTYAKGLRTHIFKQHQDNVKLKGHICNVCYTRFSTKEGLLAHESKHIKLKCMICSKQFKSMNHLKEHTLRHAALRPFKCDACPAGYVREKQLVDHMKKHNHQRQISSSTPERITYFIHIPS